MVVYMSRRTRRIINFAFAFHVWLFLQAFASKECQPNETTEGCLSPRTGSVPGEKWGYFSVRPHAHTFYWLYYSKHSGDYRNRPTILWLQGGPGASSTAYGNFMEIGPLDWHLKPRNFSWVQQANLLFVDNPVGVGFSYVTSSNAYTSTIAEVAADLVSFTKMFFNQNKDLQQSPLYIFGESYGGKMAVAFAQLLHKTVKAGAANCNLKGVAMGDSWIHPLDLTASWGPFLLETSLVGMNGYKNIQAATASVKQAIDKGEWLRAQQHWGKVQNTIFKENPNVDFYNIRQFDYAKDHSHSKREISDVYHRVPVLPASFLETMTQLYRQINGPIRKKLKIIPHNVKLSVDKMYIVFGNHSADFMKPVTDVVSDVLTNTGLQAIIYQGQWDLVCATPGALKYVERLRWPGKDGYTNAKRRKVASAPKTKRPTLYVKSFKNFKFYWIMEAGHSVPKDNPPVAYTMIQRILTRAD